MKNKGNTEKYLSYKEAWRRINSATENEFYLEVITICESIISDRLYSYVKWANQNSRIEVKSAFSKLIEKWKELTENDPPQFEGSSLIKQVDDWRLRRNEAVHGLVKSEPGSPTIPVDDFIKRAKDAAKDGKKLAKAVAKWHKEQKKLSEKPATQGEAAK